ncbi:MAG: hypothetical protein BAA02_00220 [Paenibacillaceae bacterium ZCTH02-B3]|nr:MAG: hypothetical protein BAA02_00220 [Paenibacillaceae bacterium ZCTH02-B3]
MRKWIDSLSEKSTLLLLITLLIAGVISLYFTFSRYFLRAEFWVVLSVFIYPVIYTWESWIVKRIDSKPEREGTFHAILNDLDVKALDGELSIYAIIAIGIINGFIITARLWDKTNVNEITTFFAVVIFLLSVYEYKKRVKEIKEAMENDKMDRNM